MGLINFDFLFNSGEKFLRYAFLSHNSTELHQTKSLTSVLTLIAHVMPLTDELINQTQYKILNWRSPCQHLLFRGIFFGLF